MFEFDFDDLGEEAIEGNGKLEGSLRGRGAFSAKISDAPPAPVKNKAMAKPKAKAPDLLGTLAAQEEARAAEMLARLAPPMPGYAPTPTPPPPPVPVVRADVPLGTRADRRPAREAPDDEARERASAEAAALEALERDRKSDWYQRLITEAPKQRLERCDRLPIHRDVVHEDSCPLPTCSFKVLVEAQPVRSQPCLGAVVCGGRRRGEIVRAVEATFDGWLRISGEGWICQGPEEAPGSKKCLEAIDKPRALTVETLSKTAGRQMLEVVADQGVDIYQEPLEDALVLGRRSSGEFILADSQTYNGWVRLSDGEGWVQALRLGHRLLIGIRPDELQITTAGANVVEVQSANNEAGKKEALRQLESAALSGSSAIFCAALEVARQQGVAKKDIARANAMRS